MPQNSNFRLPRGHRFFKKMEVTVMAPNHGGDTIESILGPVGSHWVKKMGQNRKKLPCPKIRIFHSSVFRKKWKLRLWRQITVGTPKGPSWGQWGPIGSQKCVKTVKNYHGPKFEFSITPHTDFSKKMGVTVVAPNHGGDTIESILGPMGSNWFQKMGKNRKNYNASKFKFSITPRSSIFRKKWKLQLWRQITVGTP